MLVYKYTSFNIMVMNTWLGGPRAHRFLESTLDILRVVLELLCHSKALPVSISEVSVCLVFNNCDKFRIKLEVKYNHILPMCS